MDKGEEQSLERSRWAQQQMAKLWSPAAGKLTQLRTFFAEVKSELKKVTWPSKKEVYATTIVVIMTTIFFGFYLYGLDIVMSRAFTLILKQ